MNNEIERISHQAALLVADLIQANAEKIKETWASSEDNKVQLSTAIVCTGGMTSPLVTVKLSFSQKFQDEATAQLDDPAQARLEGLE